MGEPAAYHQDFAGNCFEELTEACWEQGVDRAPFDCSGFVITALCDTLGVDTAQWPQQLRHVRDMWSSAEDESAGLRYGEQQVGGLWITARRYTIDGERRRVPGHIGVITKNTPDGAMEVVHASPKKGVVETKYLPPMQAARSLGTIACNDFVYL